MDLSGNQKIKDVDFMADSTPPEISCIEDAKENRLPYTLYDFSGLKKVEVFVNDKRVACIREFDNINRYASHIDLENLGIINI